MYDTIPRKRQEIYELNISSQKLRDRKRFIMGYDKPKTLLNSILYEVEALWRVNWI